MTTKHRPTISPPCRLAFVGDIHGYVEWAREQLEAVEAKTGPIDCVFQVGDFQLATQREDWAKMTSGTPNKDPAQADVIAAAWSAWKWPTAMIGGNHDAYGRLRCFEASDWGGKLYYTHAGQLPHPIKGLRVVGLSGIYSQTKYGYGYGGSTQSGDPAPESWEAVVKLKKVKAQRLTYYRQQEIEAILRLPKNPHVLMTHDWPIPSKDHKIKDHPHFQLLPALEPDWAFAGHMHTYEEKQVGRTRFIGLGDENTPVEQWCVLMRWDGKTLKKDEA